MPIVRHLVLLRCKLNLFMLDKYMHLLIHMNTWLWVYALTGAQRVSKCPKEYFYQKIEFITTFPAFSSVWLNSIRYILNNTLLLQNRIHYSNTQIVQIGHILCWENPAMFDWIKSLIFLFLLLVELLVHVIKFYQSHIPQYIAVFKKGNYSSTQNKQKVDILCLENPAMFDWIKSQIFLFLLIYQKIEFITTLSAFSSCD